jgi:dinuclear metal center YbgI/SA1388 family protein
MARIVDIIERLDGLLTPEGFRDVGPNGLQVPGTREVSRVVTGVSATRALIDSAIERRAGLIVVHHGLFWDFQPTGLTPLLAERLRPLFVHDVNLAAYHLPLDAHAEVGNNALLAQALGCTRHEPFGDYKGVAIGRRGFYDGDGPGAEALFARVKEVTGRDPTVFAGGPENVRSIGIVSGSAADLLHAAAAAGCDAFLTGEPREHVMAEAVELGIHFIAAGHYATETFGVRRLGELLAGEFALEHEFIDLPNPV